MLNKLNVKDGKRKAPKPKHPSSSKPTCLRKPSSKLRPTSMLTVEPQVQQSQPSVPAHSDSGRQEMLVQQQPAQCGIRQEMAVQQQPAQRDMRETPVHQQPAQRDQQTPVQKEVAENVRRYYEIGAKEMEKLTHENYALSYLSYLQKNFRSCSKLSRLCLTVAFVKCCFPFVQGVKVEELRVEIWKLKCAANRTLASRWTLWKLWCLYFKVQNFESKWTWGSTTW